MKYTYTDNTGMKWRFVGSRPVSELADKVMEEAERILTPAGKHIKHPITTCASLRTRSKKSRTI